MQNERFELDVNEAIETQDVKWLANQLVEAYNLLERVGDLEFEEELDDTPDGFVTKSARVQDLVKYLDVKDDVQEFLAWGGCS